MKIQKLAQWVLINVCLFAFNLSAQQGQFVHGTDANDHAHSGTFVPWTGSTVIAGTVPNGTSSFGFLSEEKTTPFGAIGFSNRYFVSGTGYQITAVCADPSNQTFITAGFSTQLNGQVHTYFHRLDAAGNVLNTWELKVKDKILITSISQSSDGKFLIGGKSETFSPQQSFAFAAKVQFVPFLAVFWQHNFVTPALSSGAIDHTVAVMERADGTYLVGGNTHFHTNTSLIVPFLAHLSNSGTLISYRHFQGTGLSFLFARDMISHPNGDVYITGVTNNGGSGSDIYLLRVLSSLSLVTYGQYIPNPANSLSEEGVSLAFNPGSTKVYFAGYATQALPSTHLDGIMIATDLATNLQAIRLYGSSANDQFIDLIPVSGGGFHAIGSTLSFSSAGLLNENIYSVRISAQLNSGCHETTPNFVRISAPGFAINVITPNDDQGLSLGPVTSRRLNFLLNSQILCSGPQFKMAPLADAELTEAVLFPNPATEVTTLRLPTFAGEAQIQLIDLQGRVLKSMTIQQSEVEIPLQGLPEGMYLVRSVVNGQVSIHRLAVGM